MKLIIIYGAMLLEMSNFHVIGMTFQARLFVARVCTAFVNTHSYSSDLSTGSSSDAGC